jgi:hypothetical protein
MFNKFTVISVILLGVAFNINAKMIDVVAPHQFQAGETATAASFNENMNNVYAAASDSQQALGLNDNIIIARNSIAETLKVAVANHPSTTNIVKILLNPNRNYYLDSSIVIPSNVTLATVTSYANGEDGANIILSNNAQIVLQANSKLRGINISGNTNQPLIVIAGENISVANSSVKQLSAAASPIKFDVLGNGEAAILTSFKDSLIQAAATTQNISTFNFVGNNQGKIILNRCVVQNQFGILTNNNVVKIKAISSEINSNVLDANLNSIFSYSNKADGSIKELVTKM